MTTIFDPYQVLGVGRDASETEIRAAYRALAKVNHPDRFATAPPAVQRLAQRKMSELNVAYGQIGSARKGEPEVADTPAARQRRREEAVRRETHRRWEEAERRARRRAEEAHDEAVRRAHDEADAQRDAAQRDAARPAAQHRRAPQPATPGTRVDSSSATEYANGILHRIEQLRARRTADQGIEETERHPA